MKIGFILSSSVARPLASTRIAVLNLLPFLRRAGHETDILFESEVATEVPVLDLDADRIAREGYQLVCFQKVAGPSVVALCAALRQRSIATLALVCDYVYEDLTRETDTTFIVTDYLRSLYPEPLRPRIRVVHDGIENPAARKTRWRSDRGSPARPLQAVLVIGSQLDGIPVIGIPPDWLKVTLVGVYPRLAGLARLQQLRARFRAQPGWRAKLRFARFLLSSRIACEPWDPATVYEHLESADIGIIAFDRLEEDSERIGAPRWKVKSENRLTMMMSVGLPVVATPIPAYEAIVVQGENGFLVEDRAQWLDALERLRDPAARRRIGERARASVVDRFSKEAQAGRWLDFLDDLRRG